MRRSTTLVAGVIAALALMLAPAATAAISTNDMNSLTASDLANALVGSGVSVSNATFSGSNVAGGTFAGGASAIGFESGIILSSGAVASVPGPNGSDSTTTSNGVAGDADLTALAGFATLDAAILEFDFVPNAGTVTFQYVFASEEYNEYVNSQFNDVFGFFVNGTNCATVGSPAQPVTINTINGGNPLGTGATNAALYRNNDLSDGGGSIDTEMDGLTVVLTCTASVNANVTNHMKLAIADGSDSALDSNVFLKAGSFTTEPPAASADLSVSKSDSPDPVTVGEELTYLVTVSNAGPAAAQSVSLTDTLPAGLTFVSATASQGTCSGTATIACDLGTIAANASATVTIKATPTAAGTLSNTASASSTTTDPSSANNSATAETTVQSAPTGCSHGYWKTHQSSWVGYTPSQTLGSVFAGTGSLASRTFAQALDFSGGNTLTEAKQILLRQAVAALLNAAHPDVDYPKTTAEIVSDVDAALASNNRSTILGLATTLDQLNNLGCPI